jgi:uncharacterized LabA/DUF88 family protein
LCVVAVIKNYRELKYRYHTGIEFISFSERILSENPFIMTNGGVFLSTDLVLLATKRLITHAAILICDADFIPAIKVAKDEGVLIRLYHSNVIGKTHDLWQCADERFAIDQDFIDRVKLVQH